MEAQRPVHAHAIQSQHSDSLTDLSDALPAPPTPFPAYQSAQNGRTVTHTTVAQITEQELSALQSTCVAALASLLPSDSQSATSLAERDRPLAAALTELLETTYELESFGPSPAYEEVAGSSSRGAGHQAARSGNGGTEASFAALAQHLASLQSGREDQQVAGSREHLQPAIDVYRQELAMERVQTLSRVVLGMVRAREDEPAEEVISDPRPNGNEGQTLDPSAHLSPEYQMDEKSHSDDLPDYSESASVMGEKDSKAPIEAGPSSPSRHAPTSEKMLYDLDNLTSAIERLGSLAPQYTDQRSVLRPVRTRSASPVNEAGPSKLKGKGREERQMSEKAKMKELEDIWRQIERSHGKRRMRDDQRVDMDGVRVRRAEGRGQFLQELYERAEMSRMKNQEGQSVRGAVDGDLARARELRDRDRFLRDLLEVSAGARLGDQDASAPTSDAIRNRQVQARQSFVQDLMDRMQSGRLETQDYPITTESRIKDQRQHLVDSLVSFSASGRMADQDSSPPTPRNRDMNTVADPYELVTMASFFKDGPQVDVPSANGPKVDGADEEKKMGTFGKIKGMMKRTSLGLGLGLKVTKETDLTQINYIAEHQENLNIVTVTLFGPNLPLTNPELALKSFDPASCSLPAVEAILQHADISLRIPMPVPILAHQSVQLMTHGLHLEAKLASVPMASFAPTLISSVSHPLSASELRELDPRGLCCTSCDREIATTGVGHGNANGNGTGNGNEDTGRFKDLPSEYWAEMMEVWMCHDDPGFTARLAAQTREGFWPAKGRVLVGGSYVLVHSADVKRSNLVQEKSKDVSWNVVSCLCGEVLGKARKEDDRPGSGAVRFSKWAIALLRDDDVDGENVEPTRYPLGVYVTSDMLALAQAHATFRFLIVDEENEEQRLMIWLFNPSVRISYRRAPGTVHAAPPSPVRASYASTHSTKSSTKSRRSSVASALSRSASRSEVESTSSAPASTGRTLRACKIMYRQVQPGDASAGGQRQPGQGQGQMEELRYPSLVVDRLLAALEASTGVYPEGRRKMGIWDVGFLGRV